MSFKWIGIASFESLLFKSSITLVAKVHSIMNYTAIRNLMTFFILIFLWITFITLNGNKRIDSISNSGTKLSHV